MDFWLRSATLQIGGNRYSMDDLAFDFEVPFEDSDELTTATVNAYNLSANTRNSIKKGDPVIINPRRLRGRNRPSFRPHQRGYARRHHVQRGLRNPFQRHHH